MVDDSDDDIPPDATFLCLICSYTQDEPGQCPTDGCEARSLPLVERSERTASTPAHRLAVLAGLRAVEESGKLPN
jgi:hypothetical protein